MTADAGGGIFPVAASEKARNGCRRRFKIRKAHRSGQRHVRKREPPVARPPDDEEEEKPIEISLSFSSSSSENDGAPAGEDDDRARERKRERSINYGSLSVIGRRREMEDAVRVEQGFCHQALSASDADPLLKGSTPVHRFSSLQSAAVLLLFLLLSLSLLLSDLLPSLLPLPHDLSFALASAAFFLQSSSSSAAASVQNSDLQAKCDSVSALVSALSSLLCLALACSPRLFVADVALGASFCLQGLWSLQTGLSLYVDAFIPEGCHKLLDVVNGVEGSTKCDLEESRLRAVAILDLVFVVHVMFVVVIVLVVYAAVAKSVGVRRMGSYEALPTTGDRDANNHIQMKALSGTQA